MVNLKNKKIVAWGASKLLEFYLKNTKKHNISYAIDSNRSLQGKKCVDLKIKSPKEIEKEKLSNTIVILFAVSNSANQSILGGLNRLGFVLNKNVYLYSDIFYKSFKTKFKKIFKTEPQQSNYDLVRSFSMTTNVPIQTTVLGNLLFLELLFRSIKNNMTCIAEVGSYNGGNSLLALSYMTQHHILSPFYIMDSFEGFPELSRFDPQNKKRGDFKIEGVYEEILSNFSVFTNAHIIRGFVPDAFSKLESDKKYGLVFYDCDLYEPALATFEYFWDKIIPGGFLLIHDYFSEENGYIGVKRATDEFFDERKIVVHKFWENTMALIIKNK